MADGGHLGFGRVTGVGKIVTHDFLIIHLSLSRNQALSQLGHEIPTEAFFRTGGPILLSKFSTENSTYYQNCDFIK